MLNIHRETIDQLNFDLETALAEFVEAKRQHTFTVDVPAPTANPLNKAQALELLKRLEGKTVATQLDGFRELLLQMFENMPG